ncbi:MAG: hypothetical protein ACXVZX_16765 [Terriglobales bacterium]
MRGSNDGLIEKAALPQYIGDNQPDSPTEVIPSRFRSRVAQDGYKLEDSRCKNTGCDQRQKPHQPEARYTEVSD